MRLVALAALALSGCASTVYVSSSECDVVGEVNTGTTIACEDGAVRIERKSVSDTTNGILGVLLRSVVGGL